MIYVLYLRITHSKVQNKMAVIMRYRANENSSKIYFLFLFLLSEWLFYYLQCIMFVQLLLSDASKCNGSICMTVDVFERPKNNLDRSTTFSGDSCVEKLLGFYRNCLTKHYVKTFVNALRNCMKLITFSSMLDKVLNELILKYVLIYNLIEQLNAYAWERL